MTERVELLGGAHWVLFRDPDTVTNRQRRPYMRAYTKLQTRIGAEKLPKETRGKAAVRILTSDSDFAAEWGLANLYMLVDDWSLDEPLMADYESFVAYLDDQRSDVFDAFTIAAMNRLSRTEDATDATDATEDPTEAEAT